MAASKKLTVDFTNVESREVLPEGEYIVVVDDIEVREGQKDKYLNWTLKVSTGQFEGRKLFNSTSLSPQSLWVLRNTLDALGVKTASAKFQLDLDSYIGLSMGVRVEHKVFEGKKRAKIVDVFPLEEASEEEPAEEQAEEAEEEVPEEDQPDEEAEEEPEPPKPVKKKVQPAVLPKRK